MYVFSKNIEDHFLKFISKDKICLPKEGEFLKEQNLITKLFVALGYNFIQYLFIVGKF